MHHRSDEFDPARGLRNALLLSVPFWIAVGLIFIGLRGLAF